MSDWEEDPVEQNFEHKPRVFRQSSSRGYRGGGGRGASSSNWRDRDGRNAQGDHRAERTDRNTHTYHGDNRKNITVASNMVGRIIGRGGSKIRDIEFETEAKVKIGESDGTNTTVTLFGNQEAIGKAEDTIMDLVVDRPPPPPPPKAFTPERNDEPINYDEPIDWDKINAEFERCRQERFSKLPPIVKDFYKEDSEVTHMSPADVTRWRRANNDIQVKRTFDDKPGLRPIPNPVTTFAQAFQDYPEILGEIKKQDFKTPSPIQSQAWPVLLRGEDLIGIAQTGTGKTLAFLLPALIHIDGQPPKEAEGPTVLVLAPTRELALQIDKEVSKYQYKNIRSVCVYGGGDRKTQIEAIKKGADIVIATPGRLNDFVVSGIINVINFSYIVLDEADRMLDMGFEPQIRKSLFDMRPDHQTVMTSATWPSGVRRLAESYMKDPIQVNVGSLDLAAVHTVTQKIMFVDEAMKEEALYDFLYSMGPDDKVIIFCGKKAVASHITSELCIKGFNCQSIHGDRDQSDREAALEDMLDGTVNILVATDVASRGIDIKDLTHVVNFDFPRHIEEYVHRVGRTGRAGKTGIALSFVTRQDWGNAGELIKILEEANQEVPDELVDMSRRFESMKIRQEREGGGRGGGRGRGGRRGGGRYGGDRW